MTSDEFKLLIKKKHKIKNNTKQKFYTVKKYCTKDNCIDFDIEKFKQTIIEKYSQFGIKQITNIFFVVPKAAPRMTKSDKWKTDRNNLDENKRQRKTVAEYFDYKNEFIKQCNEQNYSLESILKVLFVIPMPQSWSKKRKYSMLYQPHKQQPDTDNLIKGIKDSFKIDDGFVWNETSIKIWGEFGMIIMFKNKYKTNG